MRYNQAEITLITCTTVLDNSKRYVVSGDLKQMNKSLSTKDLFE